jgi:hypothetical protein
MTEVLGLEQVLLIVVNGGLGAIIYAGLNKAAWYQAIAEPDLKRWIAAGITAASAVLAWLALVGLQFFPLPASDWRSWLVQLANIAIGAFASFETATLLHTKVEKREYAAAQETRRQETMTHLRERARSK